MTVPILPQLEEMLRQAAVRRAQIATLDRDTPEAEPSPNGGIPETARRLPGAPRRRSAFSPPRRRASVVALLAFVATGTAIAATQPWNPLIGDETRGHPTITSEPPPSEELAMLSVLRRPQNDADRGTVVSKELRIIGIQEHGVRTAYIRNLGPAPDEGAVVLVPSLRFGDVAAGPPYVGTNDALCVLFPFSGMGGPSGAAYPCWSAGQVEAGQAFGTVRSGSRHYVFGLVPDGVVTVVAYFADRNTEAAPVNTNFFEFPLLTTAGTAALSPTRLEWLDGAGRAIPTAAGGQSTNTPPATRGRGK